MQSVKGQDTIKHMDCATYPTSRPASKEGPNGQLVPVLTLEFPLREFKC